MSDTRACSLEYTGDDDLQTAGLHAVAERKTTEDLSMRGKGRLQRSFVFRSLGAGSQILVEVRGWTRFRFVAGVANYTKKN